MAMAMATAIETVNFEDDFKKGMAGLFLTIPGMEATKKYGKFGKYVDKNVSFRWVEKTSSRIHLEVSIKGNGKYYYKHDLKKGIDPDKTKAEIATTKKVVVLLAKKNPQEKWSEEDAPMS